MDYLEKNWGLTNRRVLVTGSSKGIGRGIAIALAAAGARVMIHYHTGKRDAEGVVAEIRNAGGEAWMHGGDLTVSGDANGLLDAIRDRWGSLDILVNNVGGLIARARIEDISDEVLDAILAVNLKTAVHCTRAAIPLLRSGTQPVIINISSIAARNGGADGTTMYAAMKGALVSFTRGLAKELAPDIRVNGVAPAAVPTAFLQDNIDPERLKRIADQAPLKRLGTVEDTAAAVAFLCGGGSSYITGEVLDVSGGRRFTF